MKIFYLFQMLDIISKENSINDVSKENKDYLAENPKINSDDSLFANFNLSNSFEDNSINEMTFLDMNLPLILKNDYNFENRYINNNLFSPSPSIKEFSNDFPFSINPTFYFS